MKLKPWREIITPHDTVLQGTLACKTPLVIPSLLLLTLFTWR